MKTGFRTPNIKKSLKARTTGKVNRAIKKSVNPLYGKKGMGYVNNPKKAVYNKVYNKTTIDVRPSLEEGASNGNDSPIVNKNYIAEETQYPRKKGTVYLGFAVGFYLVLIAFLIYIINGMRKYPLAKTAPFNYIFPIVLFAIATSFLKIYKNKNKQ